MTSKNTQYHSSVGSRSLSVADVAAATSFSQETIRDEINRGNLPAIRLGRRIAVREDDLRSWLNSLPRFTD